MNKNVHLSKLVASSLLIASLTLASCSSQKSDSASEPTTSSTQPATAKSDEILLRINNEPVLTVPEFEQYYEQLLEQQPQLKSFAAFMPDLKLNIYATLVSQKVLEYWVKQEGIDKKDAYQADRKMLIENVERGLAIKYFQEQHPVKVSDSDVKQYYDKNKETIYLMSPAGINAVGVSFDKEDAAKAFLTKAQQPGADLTKLATQEKLTARPFPRVNADAQGMEQGLKDKIMAIKTFPSVQLIKVDKTFWVVQAKGKDEAKYYPFDQAKEDAKNRLEQERMGEMFNTEIEKLKNKYKISEDKSYFESKKEEQKPAQAAQANEPVAKKKPTQAA